MHTHTSQIRVFSLCKKMFHIISIMFQEIIITPNYHMAGSKVSTYSEWCEGRVCGTTLRITTP